MKTSQYRVLLVEDNRGDVRLVELMLADQSSSVIEVDCAGSLAAAMDLLRSAVFDAVLLDLGLPDSDGIETLDQLLQEFPTLCVIVLTGNSDLETAMLALDKGAQDYLLKREVHGGLLARTIQYAVERRRTQDALVASERLNREIVETIGEGLWIIDHRWRTTFVNGAVPQMLGCEASEILGRTPFDFVKSSDVAATERRLAAVSQFQRQQFEFELLRRDGRTVRVLMSVTALPLRGGRFTGALAAMTDITARTVAEESLRQSELAFRMAQEVAHIGHWHWNPETGETLWSDETHRIFEIEIGQETPSYDTFLSLVDPADRPLVASSLQRLLEKNTSLTRVDLDLRVVTRSGNRKTVAERVVTDRDAQGRVLLVRGTIQDITDRKAIEETLRQRTANLEHANAELERFNRAAVGRELRMIELKREINRLCGELERPPRYTLPPEQAFEGSSDESKTSPDLAAPADRGHPAQGSDRNPGAG